MNSIDPRVIALATALVDLFDALAPKARATNSDHYTTSKVGTLPPGKSRRWFRDHAREIPGAYKVGRDWIVSIVDFDAWVSAHASKRSAHVVPIRPTPWSPESALVAAGVRAQTARGAR